MNRELEEYLSEGESETTAPTMAGELPDYLMRPENDPLRAYIDEGTSEDAAPAVTPAAPTKPRQPPLQAFGAGLMRGGVQDPLDTVSSLLDPAAKFLERGLGFEGRQPPIGLSTAEATANREAGQAQYNETYGDDPYATAGRVTGNVAATAIPLIRGGQMLQGTAGIGNALTAVRSTGTTGKMLANALTGAAAGGAGAAMVSGGYEDPAVSQIGQATALGGALGPLAPVFANVLGRAYTAGKGVFSKLAAGTDELAPGARVEPTLNAASTVVNDPAVGKALDEVGLRPGDLNPEVSNNLLKTAQTQAGQAGTLNPEQLARAANFEALGLKPTQGLVTRDPLQFAREIELAKTPEGAVLLANKITNNQILRTRLDELGLSTEGSAGTNYEAGKSAVDASFAKYDELQGNIRQLYKNIEDELGDQFTLVPRRLHNTLSGQEGEAYLSALAEANGTGFFKAVSGKLRQLGLLDEEDELIDTASIGVKEADALRKFIGNLSAPTKTMKGVQRELIDALDDDVISSTGDDFYKTARDAARARFTEFGVSKTAGPGKAGMILKAIIDGKATPDNLVTNYIIAKNAPLEAITGLKQSLTTSDAPQAALQVARGTQAWNDIRRSVADFITTQATSKNPSEGFVSYPGLRNAMEKIGKEKLQVIFGEDGERRLRQVLSAAKDLNYAPPGAPINTSNTANELMNRLVEMSKKGEGAGNLAGLLGAAAGEPSALLANVAGTVTRGAAERSASKQTNTAVQNALKPVWEKPIKEPASLLNPSSNVPNALLIPGAVSATNPDNRSQ